MKVLYKKKSLLILLVTIIFAACNSKSIEPSWNYSDYDVVGYKLQKPDKINIDIYLDGTGTMQGFATNPNSNYSQFLDQLEASVLSQWKNASVQYYKFGEKTRNITRADFLNAKTAKVFYQERGLSSRTYIDSVINKTDISKLSVIITDLFQNEADVNSMVNQIKEKCFVKGIQVGIMGLESEFNGRISDVPKPYSLNTKSMPFYAFVFGNPSNMEYLFNALQSSSFVSKDKILVVSNFIVKSYDVVIEKNKKSTSVKKRGAPKDKKDVQNVFWFSMDEDKEIAEFKMTCKIEKHPYALEFLQDKIELVVFKKSINEDNTKAADSVITSDIEIEQFKIEQGIINCNLKITNKDKEGNYSYLVYLKIKDADGFKTPVWIKNNSTNEPIAKTESENKTFNLEKLINRLVNANSAVNKTYLTKFYINIKKN